MSPEVLKIAAKYGAASIIAVYLSYAMVEIVSNKLDKNTGHLEAIEDVMVHSNQLQEEMLKALEISNQLHRIRYGLRLDNVKDEVLN